MIIHLIEKMMMNPMKFHQKEIYEIRNQQYLLITELLKIMAKMKLMIEDKHQRKPNTKMIGTIKI